MSPPVTPKVSTVPGTHIGPQAPLADWKARSPPWLSGSSVVIWMTGQGLNRGRLSSHAQSSLGCDRALSACTAVRGQGALSGPELVDFQHRACWVLKFLPVLFQHILKGTQGTWEIAGGHKRLSNNVRVELHSSGGGPRVASLACEPRMTGLSVVPAHGEGVRMRAVYIASRYRVRAKGAPPETMKHFVFTLTVARLSV